MRQEESHAKGWVVIAGLFALVLLDLVIKYMAIQFRWVVWNEGGIWGILPGRGWLIISIVVLGCLGWFFRVKQNRWQQAGLIFIMAGGLGNLIDRIIYSSVRDFIYYPYLEVYGNLADIYLIAGIIMVIIGEKKRKKYEI